MNQDSHSHLTHASWYQRPYGVAGAMAVLIIAFYLLREHWNHIAGYWSYLLLLACPLMHLFHGGHHSRGGHPRATDDSAKDGG